MRGRSHHQRALKAFCSVLMEAKVQTALLLTFMGACGTALGAFMVVLHPKMQFKRLGLFQVIDQGRRVGDGGNPKHMIQIIRSHQDHNFAVNIATGSRCGSDAFDIGVRSVPRVGGGSGDRMGQRLVSNTTTNNNGDGRGGMNGSPGE